MPFYVTICGQVGDGPVMRRTVSVGYAIGVWRGFFPAIYNSSASSPFVVGDKKVWVEL